MYTKTLTFLVILLSFLLVRCERKSDTIKIGYNPISYDLPFFVAIEKGFFAEEGLKVEPINFATSNLMAESLVSDQIDVATSASITVMFGIEQNVPAKFKIFMVHVSTASKPADFIIVKKDSKIEKVEDLKGKTIGTHQGSTVMVYANLALAKYFNPEKDINLIQLSPEVQIQALETGQVDALFTYEPIGTLSLEKGVGRILVSAPKNLIMDPMPSGAYAFSSTFAEKRPEDAKRVLKAMEKAVDFIRTNEEDAKMYISKYTPIKDETARRINVIPYWKLEEIDPNSVQSFCDLLFEAGDLKKKLKTESLFLPANYGK